ncbi:TetR/AcrR family transcriptional regulator [Sphingomonas oligophenolica]|uniref:Helix-turn-helix domain-containing protein n=1 Tax=Sphingomonas oligophenolica TaxID=301154 RepID=A0ABU9YCN4_9SPHN
MTVKRRYSSARRDLAAEQTRHRVLLAAKTLFAESGIDSVTIAEIAEQAGVAASTIYGLFKSKAGLVEGLMRASLFGERYHAAMSVMDGVADAAMRIALTPSVSRAIYEGEILEMEIIRGASAFSSGLREIEARFEAMRYEMQADRIEALFAQGKAKSGLDQEDARRIMWVHTSREVFRMLIVESGWSPEKYEHWLADTLLDALVAPHARPLHLFD